MFCNGGISTVFFNFHEYKMNKIIIFGRLEFLNKRGINLAKDSYIRFCEKTAKGDIIYSPESIFGEEPEEAEIDFLHIDFPMNRTEAEERRVTNTIDGLKTLLEYAVAGMIDVFVRRNGDFFEQTKLEVRSGKSPAKAYNKGIELFEQEEYEGAILKFDRAIAKYENFSWAYNQRGLAYMELKKYDEALADFEKCKELYPHLPSPYLGIAQIQKIKGNSSAAVDNCLKAIKNSIPLQPGYWICSLFQAEILIEYLEKEHFSSEQEAENYYKTASYICQRYDYKLKSLGNNITSYYPSRETLTSLQDRLKAVEELSAA